MKKIVLILFLLIALTGCNKEMTNNKISEKNKESFPIKESNNSNSEENKTEEEKEVINDSTKEAEKEINKQNATNKKTNENDNSKKNTESKVQQKVENEEKPQVKERHTCTNEDIDYVAWKTNYLKDNNSTRFFESYDEAYNYGDKISLKYYYGFIVQTTPTTYSDDNCSKTHYTMQLFVPQGICENNPMTYLPNDINLDNTPLNTIDYLKKIGYECAGKNL